VRREATEGERGAFSRALDGFRSGGRTLNQVKGVLRRLAVKYQQSYLLEGYYFTL